MRYAISYVSSANTDLSILDVKSLLNNVEQYNNRNDITGILLSSDTNFFQLIEGEEIVIKNMYAQILLDDRHDNLIKFIDKPVVQCPIMGYLSQVVTD